MPTIAFAVETNSDKQSHYNTEIAYQKLTKEYRIPKNEINSLNVNLKNAIKKIDEQNTQNNKIASVRVSNNLILEKRDNVVSRPAKLYSAYSGFITKLANTSYYRTASSVLELKNLLGFTIVTLKTNGVFFTDGTVSKPTDAYGSYSGFIWKLSNKSSAKGQPAFTSWARNTFTGELNIGIDAIHLTLASFSHTGTVYCSANGAIRSNWS